MRIRTATTADIPRVAELERAVFAQDALPFVALVQYRELAQELFVVAEGAPGLLAYGAAAIAADARTGWLLSAGVAPEARGQGVGGALTRELVARLQARGVAEVRATVAPHNTASRRMLSSAGLTVQAELPDYFGPGEHRLLMRWTSEVVSTQDDTDGVGVPHSAEIGAGGIVSLDGAGRAGHGPPMKIAADTVVSIDYVLTNDAGEVLDRSGDEPLAYLHGHENIVPGLEAALDGLSVGDATQAKLTPDQGYGERDDKKVRQISRTELPPGMEIEVGEALQGQDEDGNIFPLWVVKTDAESITLDGNHPLAGQNLNFDVTVREIRAATEEELHHGHVHGPGGHHHH